MFNQRRIRRLLDKKDRTPNGPEVARVDDKLRHLCCGDIGATVAVFLDGQLSRAHCDSLFGACMYMATLSPNAAQHELVSRLRASDKTNERLRDHCDWYAKVHGVGASA